MRIDCVIARRSAPRTATFGGRFGEIVEEVDEVGPEPALHLRGFRSGGSPLKPERAASIAPASCRVE